MASAADYRQRAEECLRLANEAKEGYHKKNFSRLATMWSEMASKTEAREEFATTLSEIEDIIRKQDGTCHSS
jgi:hypothetical protein